MNCNTTHYRANSSSVPGDPTNPRNVGFVGTANRGMRHAGNRDVLLLNSDTEVFAGFLERLRAAAYAGPRVGMVSPLSNNATICSVPVFAEENPIPEGLTGDEMAALVANVSDRRHPELVTPHGFCLYLRRDCLDDIGLFDEERFGRGFGEENDLGERAKARGFEIRLADDTYVFHRGKASFSDEGRALEQRHALVLERLHPGYHAAVAAFVRDNPLSGVQRNVSRHLARGSHRLSPAPLFILHADPFSEERGGVEHCVTDLVRALAPPRAVILYPKDDALEVAEVFHGDLARPAIHRYGIGHAPERFCHDHLEARRAFEEILDLHRVGYAHIHHLMFLPLSLGDVLRARGIPYVVTLHDFYAACPSYNFLNLQTLSACCPAACGDARRTVACQRALFSAMGEAPPADPGRFVAEHRRLFSALLDGAERVLFPVESARELTHRVLALPMFETRSSIVPHGYEPRSLEARAPASGPLRVALVGQIAYRAKGADAYLAAILECASAPIEWHVFGRVDLFGFESRLAKLRGAARIVSHGPYRREDIVGKLRAAHVDVGLLLPAWPETFSYTLSELEAAGVPVVARRIGALGDRLAGKRHAVLVEDVAGAASALRRLASDRAFLNELSRDVPRPEGMVEWARVHRELYAECAARSPIQGAVAASDADCRRLNQHAVEEGPSSTERVSITRPDPAHTGAWWYPYADRVKTHLPESIRHAARRRLAADRTTTVLAFRLPGRRARVGGQLTIDKRYVVTTLLTSHGPDPELLLSFDPFDPASVDSIRFNLWCSTTRPAHAQLYFLHAGVAAFDEAHSFIVPLDGKAAAWQEYVIDVRESDRREAWYQGGAIVGLRFDPIDAPGPIGLGELALCRRERP